MEQLKKRAFTWGADVLCVYNYVGPIVGLDINPRCSLGLPMAC